MIKQHTGIQTAQVAVGVNKSLDSLVETVAVGAGSGGYVLKGVEADLYITGMLFIHLIGIETYLCEYN